MKLHSYVVARDYGFAPNPFYGICTLCTCKPVIRKGACVGDWVIGTGSKTRGLQGKLVFAMRVTEKMTFNEYWDDPRFQQKKPNLRGSKKQAFGDNIYRRDPATGAWLQADSHHSLTDGSPNPLNINHDTQADSVLIGQEYIYWGGDGPTIPPEFRNFDDFDICAGRGHKNQFPDDMVQNFVAWLRSLDERGYRGTPFDWAKSP